MNKLISKKAVFLFLLMFSLNGFSQISVEQQIYNKGVENFQKENFYQAIDDFNILINRNKVEFSVYSYLLRGSSKSRLGKFSDAISDFTSALIKHPKNPLLLNGRAWAYCFTGNYNSALTDVSNAIMQSKEGAFYDTRATAYGLLRSYSNAISDFNEAIKLESKALYYYKRGLMKRANKDFAGAENDFKTARALDNAESFKKSQDPFFSVFTENKSGTTNTSTTNSYNTKSSPSLTYKAYFGKWSILFPGKPTEQTSSNSSFNSNFTAHFQTGDWIYMVQYIVIDMNYFKKYLMNDFLKEIREQYVKNINGSLGTVSTVSNKNFDDACQYSISGGGMYGLSYDGIIDNKVLRISLYNSKRYPTYSELMEFYNTMSARY